MKIRDARVEDAAAIAAVVHSINELGSITDQQIDSTIRKISDNLLAVSSSPNSVVLVAEEHDGALVAYCAGHWTPLLFLPGGEAYVTELFVRTQDSGLGVGSRLLSGVRALAARHGCSRVSVLNGRRGESYRRQFYAKQGWIEREQMANFILPLEPDDPPNA